jgi:hypothetical protein
MSLIMGLCFTIEYDSLWIQTVSERRLRLVHVPPEEGRDGTSACGSHNDHLTVSTA